MEARPLPTAPPPGEPARSLRISIWEGCSSALFGALSGEALVIAFLLALGASDLHLGLYSALGTLATAGGLLGARATGALGRWKPLVIGPSVASRLCPALAAALPWVPISASARLWTFLALMFISSLLVNFAANPWISWMAALVPPDRRGRYFALRNAIVNGVGMAATYAVGWLATEVRRRGADGAAAVAPFFVASAVFALLTTWLYTRQWEPPGRVEAPLPMHQMWAAAWAAPAFRRLIVFSAAWALVCGIAAPFFAPHMQRQLQMPLRTVAVYSILAGLTGIAAQPLWGRAADRAGHRPTLVITAAAVAGLPLLWLLAAPGRLWPIWLDAVLTGIAWPGFNLAHFNLALAVAPERHRTACLAVRGLVTGVVQSIAALTGGALAHAIGTACWEWGPFQWVNHHALFVVSSMGRFALLPLAARLPEPGAWPAAALARLALTRATRLFADGLASGWTFVRPRRRAAGGELPATRRSAPWDEAGK
ncbi:MAG: MFS transporter [Kiritimatiellae bacterium]|nr:MFS transporter [Kiritimatiellia bacterium]